MTLALIKQLESLKESIKQFEDSKSNSMTNEKSRCKADPVYFVNTHCKIQDRATERAIPFSLYPSQTDVLQAFLNNDRNIVLKARQLGLTWLSAAYALWLTIFHSQQFVLAISIKEELAVEYLDRLKFIFDHLPEELKPRVFKRTTSVIWFGQEIKDGKGNAKIVGLNSQIKSVPTSKEAGRSKSLSLLVIDEAAFVENSDSIWRASEPTLEETDGKAIVISTANGMGGWFHGMWTKAKRGENSFSPVFLPWSAHPDRDEAWYQRKVQEAISEDDIHQEFPANDTEAFIASGRPAFDMKALTHYYENASDPINIGNLSLEAGKPVFQVDAKGYLKIWQFPEPGKKYVIGADVAEGLGNGDYSAAHVLDVKNMEVAAEMHLRIDPDLFGVELCKLGHYFNGALLGVERNNHGLTTLTTLRQGHPIYTGVKPYHNLYFEETVDYANNKATHRFGWSTNLKTRPLAIDDCSRVIRERLIGLPSKETVEECMSFVIDYKGKAAAAPGQYDDRVMALAIAIQMQQNFKVGLLPEFNPYIHTQQ